MSDENTPIAIVDDAPCADDDDDYIVKENEIMRKNYAVNCSKLFNDVYAFIKNGQEGNVKFCVSQIKFSTGNENISLFDNLLHIAQELRNQSNARIAKNLAAIEKAEKAGRPRPPINDFVPFDYLQITFHNYGINDVSIYVQNNEEMVAWLQKHYPHAVVADANDCYTILLLQNNSTNAMSLSDDVHKTAFAYYIDKGLIVRDNNEDELIFDEDLF
jgi:hypothetical protein